MSQNSSFTAGALGGRPGRGVYDPPHRCTGQASMVQGAIKKGARGSSTGKGPQIMVVFALAYPFVVQAFLGPVQTG